MLFNSAEFLLFFPAVTLAYYALPHRWRWPMLLLASCLFYMAFVPAYILILGLTIVIDYAAGIYLEQTVGSRRRYILLASIVSTCLVLFVFKYYNFITSNLNGLAQAIGWNYSIESLGLVLPIGLSFHTFQSLSYVIEVYWGKQKAERNFGIYSLYVMFYPQLVAGPIERPQNLLHQFHEEKRFEYETFVSGLRLMLWGFFKKVVIADRLALYVNAAFAEPAKGTGSHLAIAVLFFAFQIYCDFSGYSDIARGSARAMGFELMRNFDRPYFSSSVSEFWRRWHMSLSTWFKDYVFIPLGGSRVSLSRRSLNLGIVFLLSGLWHGANWTYVVWGALHGAFLVIGLGMDELRGRIQQKLGWKDGPITPHVVRVLFTFTAVCFAWIFFRAPSMAIATTVIEKVVRFSSYRAADITTSVLVSSALIAFLLGAEHWQRTRDIEHLLGRLTAPMRWSAYVTLTLAILYLGTYDVQDFIYFQF